MKFKIPMSCCQSFFFYPIHLSVIFLASSFEDFKLRTTLLSSSLLPNVNIWSSDTALRSIEGGPVINPSLVVDNSSIETEPRAPSSISKEMVTLLLRIRNEDLEATGRVTGSSHDTILDEEDESVEISLPPLAAGGWVGSEDGLGGFKERGIDVQAGGRSVRLIGSTLDSEECDECRNEAGWVVGGDGGGISDGAPSGFPMPGVGIGV